MPNDATRPLPRSKPPRQSERRTSLTGADANGGSETVRTFLVAGAGCAACAALAKRAATPSANCHDRCCAVFMSGTRSKAVRAALRHDSVVKPTPIDAIRKHCHGRGAPIVAAVENREIAAVADQEQQMVLPQFFEFGLRDRARALGRIADQHASGGQALDHHEMVITVFVDQHDGRQVRPLQLVQRRDEAVGFEPACHQEALDVQQRKTFLRDLRAIAVREHRRERRLLAHRIVVLVGQQRGDRRRSATEVVLLVDGVAEAQFLERGDGHAIVAARDARELRLARHRNSRQQREQPQSREHSPRHGCNCTLTTVAFWISTLLPLFCITIGRPAALPKAPPPIQFMPVLTFSVEVLDTLPWMLMFWVTLLPPLKAASAAGATLGPKPAITLSVCVAVSGGDTGGAARTA